MATVEPSGRSATLDHTSVCCGTSGETGVGKCTCAVNTVGSPTSAGVVVPGLYVTPGGRTSRKDTLYCLAAPGAEAGLVAVRVNGIGLPASTDPGPDLDIPIVDSAAAVAVGVSASPKPVTIARTSVMTAARAMVVRDRSTPASPTAVGCDAG